MISATRSFSRLGASLGSNALFLLVFTMLAWGGNVVAARAAAGNISPMALVCGRWTLVLALMLGLGRNKAASSFKALLPHWRFVGFMGFVGFTLSNSMLYEGAVLTTGVNVALIQALTPIFVLIGARWLYHARPGRARVLGAALTVAGIALVASQGRLANLAALRFNRGDLIAMGGAALYGVFILGLRNRPSLPGYDFFLGIAIAAFATSVPALLIEWFAGATIWPDATGLVVLFYVAIFTSLLGQVCFIRAVELVGPSRAGMFQNLVPVIGALLSALVLRESLRLYDFVALALVISGIFLSERFGRR